MRPANFLTLSNAWSDIPATMPIVMQAQKLRARVNKTTTISPRRVGSNDHYRLLIALYSPF